MFAVDSEPVRTTELIRFGEDFELDLRAYELRRGGRSLKLEPIPMGLLALLVERRGELVTRDQIIERVWGKDVYFDSDNSINSAVRKLRQALKDDPDHARFILTVTGKGYRFIAPIEEAGPSAAPSGTSKETTSSSDAVFPGKKISHYRIMELLGGGGMGVVYRAEDLKLGRQVALKFLAGELAGDPVAFERLQREARAACLLDHPNICSIYQLAEHEGQPFIVMQLLEGETLREWILKTADSPAGLQQVLELADQILDGLGAAHEKGIIHRDIKPANIFITNRGQAKILDFGVAKFLDASDLVHPKQDAGNSPSTDPQLTRTGVSVGTPSYLSPEQINREKLDGRTDLFSFGLVLYEMATRKRAFSGHTVASIREALLNQSPTPLRQLCPDLPEELERIVARSLEKDRNARYQSAKEMRDALARLSNSVDPALRSKGLPDSGQLGVTPVSAADALTSARMGRWRVFLRWAILLLLLLAVGSGAVWWLDRPHTALRPFRQRRLTSNSATDPVYGAAISRDGKYLGYADREGIHLQLVSTGETHNLTPPTKSRGAEPMWLFGDWFPDSTRFTATLLVPGKPASLWSIPMLGSPTLLVEDVTGSSKVSPDGSAIAFFRVQAANGSREIWLMGSQGESPHRLVSSEGRESFFKVAWDLAGNRIAFAKRDYASDLETISIESCDLNGNNHAVVLALPNVIDFVWRSRESLIYSMAGRGNSFNLWEVPLRNGIAVGKPLQLTDWSGFFVDDLSTPTGGGPLAFLRGTSHEFFFIGELGRGGLLSNPRLLTDDDSSDIPLAWTSDSREVIFSSVRGRSRQIYRQMLDGSSPPRLITSSSDVSFFLARTAPDAASLVVEGVSSKSGKIGLYRVLVDGGVPQLLFETGGMVNYRCGMQPLDFCVYTAMVPDQTQIVITAFNPVTASPKEFMRIPVEAGAQYDWALSPNGREIAIVKEELTGCNVRLLDVGKDEEHTIPLSGILNCTSLDWAWDSMSMFIAGSRAGTLTLLRVAKDGKVQPLWTQPHASGTWGVPSPDGRYLAIRSDSTDANVWSIDE